MACLPSVFLTIRETHCGCHEPRTRISSRAIAPSATSATTPEPAGARTASADGHRFVVQQHDATRLHWDLRLEHDGVLASWAMPNGIPADPADNRLAVRTEDHPLEYLEFHGEIPKGQYGAGTMTIWDQGTFEVHKWEERKVEVTFHGERLSGRYGLFPIGKPGESQERLDDPPDGSAVGSGPRADARAPGADDGAPGGHAPARPAQLVVRGQVGRRARDRLRPARAPAPREPQPQRDHRRLPRGPRPAGGARHARGGARRRDRRVRRRRPPQLRAAPAADARDLAERGPAAAWRARRSCTRSSTCCTSTATR